MAGLEQPELSQVQTPSTKVWRGMIRQPRAAYFKAMSVNREIVVPNSIGTLHNCIEIDRALFQAFVSRRSKNVGQGHAETVS